MEFQEFTKIGRLTRDVVISEKIDGTNAHVAIEDVSSAIAAGTTVAAAEQCIGTVGGFAVWAGSRTRYITPTADNFGFAKWVSDNLSALVTLGVGRHYGEWWGSGIQRGYGLDKGEKRFSLFNTIRWALHGNEPQLIPKEDPRLVVYQDVLPACVGLVPVLYRGLFVTEKADNMIDKLRHEGSFAAPGFMNPEGVVVYHTASGVMFKKTLDKDEKPKSAR